METRKGYKPVKTCYIYIRVSTDEQKNRGYSPDNQIRQAREYAKMHEYQIINIFDDSGRSGRTTEKRLALQEMLEAINEHPVDAIIIYKIDRFARNVGDFDRMYKEFKAKGIKLLSINEGDLMEGNSLIPNIFASVAQWESEVNSSRTKDALAQKYEEGWQPTHSRYHGYRSVGGENEKKTCEIDPFVAPIIKELFELYATGNYSIVEIQDWLADKNILSGNGTVLSHSVINSILRNPFYYGLIRWHGQSKIGKHDPIIDKQLFDTCQYVLAKHRNFLVRKRTHDYLLRGFIFCNECGQRYTADSHKINSKARKDVIHYYHCPKRGRNGCTAPYVEMDKLEQQVFNEIGSMQFSQEFIDKVVEKTRLVVEENRRTAGAVKQGIYNQKHALEIKRNKLEDNLLDGVIERSTYKRKHAEIEDKIMNLDNSIQELEAKSRIDINLIEEVLSFSRDIQATYSEAPQFLKRHYLRFFFEKMYVANKKIVRTVPTPIFLVLQANHAVINLKTLLPREDSNL